MENNSVLKARRKCPIQISYNGNEQCFHKHVDSIQSALGRGSISWRRNETPVNTQFDLKIVNYREDLIWQSDEVSYCESVAFIHLYFVYASTVEEYKNKLRYDIVDWFAQLSKAQNNNWLIIYDSTKAREKKNRGSVLEKLKSDFAKYQEKLVEICDGNSQSMAELTTKIKTTFLNSLDGFLGNYEKSYALMKVNWEHDDWDITAYVNQQFNLCRFFWNLSMYDAVSKELDKVDVFITEMITSSNDNRPKWLMKMRDQGLGETCPLMRLLTHVEGAPENVSLIELRTFILANQVLSIISVYNSRRKDAILTPLTGRSDLQNEFANILLKCGFNTIQNLRDELYDLDIRHDPVLFYIWVSLVLTDIIELVEEMFVSVDELKQDQNVLCQLIHLKCNSLYEVYMNKSSSRSVVRTWLKATVAQRNADILGLRTAEILNVLRRTFLERNELEGSPDQGKSFDELVDDVLVKGIKLINKYNWNKVVCELIKCRFDISRSIDDDKKTKELYFELLNTLFNTCSIKGLLVHYCKLGLHLFPKFIHSDRDFIIDILLLLSMESDSLEDRRKFGESLLNEASEKVEVVKKYNFTYKIPSIYPLSISKVSGPFLTSLLNEPVVFNLTILNRFDFELPDCKIQAIFKRLSKSITEPINPLFTCSSSDLDNSSRCLAKAKGLSIKKDYQDILEESVNSIEEDSPIFLTNKDVSLKSGLNDVELLITATKVGSFALNHIEVMCGNSLLFVINYQQSIAELPSLDNVYLMIDLRLPTVELNSKPETLLAGIAQKISLKVTAGTNAIEESTKLRVSYKGDPKVMEFLDEEVWTNEIFLTVPSLRPHEDAIVDLILMLPIDEMHFSSEESVLTTRQLQVEWLNQKWLIELEFLPIMRIKMSTTIVEDRVLFALDVSRTDGFDFLDLELLEAKLEQKQSISKPKIAAKLINPKLGIVESNSTHRIVWELPQSNIDKSIPIKHYLSVQYKSTEGKGNRINSSKCSIPYCGYSRDYQFLWDQELAISKAEFYICAQVVPTEHTSSCRLNQECDLVVSLKQLSNHTDTRIVVTVDADPCYWSVPTKCSVVQMKESGIGQTDFTIIPKQTGYLPCPSVYIHQCNPDYNDKDPIIEAKVLGERLNTYHRLAGKQIWSIPSKLGNDDALSQTPSTTGSLRTVMKRAFKSVASKMDRDKE